MAPDAVPSWAALIARLHADDENALREVMDTQYDDIVALAYHYVRTQDLAHDVAQEVFISVWERRHQLQIGGNLAGYLRRAARNTAITMLTRDHSAARMEDALLREYEVVRPHDENVGLSDIESAEFNARVRAVLATLSPRVREIALLYHERGLEPGEIAEMLDLAPSTVYTQIHKAIRALAEGLRGDGPGAPS